LSACARAPLLPAMNRDSANHDLADRALQLKREPFNLPSYRSRSIIRHCDLSATRIKLPFQKAERVRLFFVRATSKRRTINPFR